MASSSSSKSKNPSVIKIEFLGLPHPTESGKKIEEATIGGYRWVLYDTNTRDGHRVPHKTKRVRRFKASPEGRQLAEEFGSLQHFRVTTE